MGVACGRREIPWKLYGCTSYERLLEAVVCGACNSFWGVRSGFAYLALDMAPICRGSGPMCCGDPPPRLPFTPVKLLHSMCVVCVLALPGWSVVSFLRVVSRQLVFVYVDAALARGMYRMGLFSLDLLLYVLYGYAVRRGCLGAPWIRRGHVVAPDFEGHQ